MICPTCEMFLSVESLGVDKQLRSPAASGAISSTVELLLLLDAQAATSEPRALVVHAETQHTIPDLRQTYHDPPIYG